MILALRVALSLAAVLGLLWFLQRRFARTAARRRDAETITVLGRQGLGTKAQLVVVQIEDARYVLGVTEHGVSVVDRLPVAADTVPVAASVDSAESPHSSDSGADEFDRILAAASASPGDDGARTAGTHSAPVSDELHLRRRTRHRSDPLRGSILSPDTWRQTAEAIRRAR